jgi:hypothetical protein
MWKPGTAKPSGSLTSSPSSASRKKKRALRPKLDLGISDDDDNIITASTRTDGPSSATPRKRLSGGTMNMKFMKRRKDAINANSNDDSEKRKSDSSKKNSSHARMQNNNAMDVEENSDISTEIGCEDGSKYAQATSVDMYGIEASLIGRRSFRGFNAPIQRIWKDSKAFLENGAVNNRPGNKVSDEELLLRYKDTGKQRGSTGGGRGVGNLDKKNRNKKRR